MGFFSRVRNLVTGKGWCEDADTASSPREADENDDGYGSTNQPRTGFKTTKVRTIPVAPVVQHAKHGGVQGLGWRRATVHTDEDGDEADEFFDEHGKVVRTTRRTV